MFLPSFESECRYCQRVIVGNPSSLLIVPQIPPFPGVLWFLEGFNCWELFDYSIGYHHPFSPQKHLPINCLKTKAHQNIMLRSPDRRKVKGSLSPYADTKEDVAQKTSESRVLSEVDKVSKLQRRKNSNPSLLLQRKQISSSGPQLRKFI